MPVFSPNALGGAYQVVDYLPSGLRPTDREVTSQYDNRARVFPIEINDQKVTFVINKDNTLPVYYYARVVSKGEYQAEPARLQSLRGLSSLTLSDATRVTIK